MRSRHVAATAFLALVWLVFTIPGHAQSPPKPSETPRAQSFKWWQDEQFRTELGLTADQSAKIESIYQTLLPKLKTSKERLDQVEARLSEMINGSVSEGEVMQQASVVESARSELSMTRTLMLFRMRQVLSPDQRTKMKALHDAREKARRGSDHR